MADDYIAFCKKLWRRWLKQILADSPLKASPFVGKVKVFDLNAAPEPYTSFAAGKNALVLLTTNPGSTMPHQRRAALRARRGPLRKEYSYAKAARKLGDYCEMNLTGQARQRIARARMLSMCSGHEGVRQVELFPFHSRTLPKTKALLGEIKPNGSSLLGCYVERLSKFLQGSPVVAIQAVSTSSSLTRTRKLSAWLRWVAEIAGLNLNAAKFVPLVKKGSKTTAAAWVSNRKDRKTLVLMMGANNLPGSLGLFVLADELRRLWEIG